MERSRRTFLQLAGVVILGGLGAHVAKAADSICYNAASLPLSQKGARRSLNFQDVSSDPKKHCSLCAYFSVTKGICGTCALLNGGSVTASSVCDNFAPKAA